MKGDGKFMFASKQVERTMLLLLLLLSAARWVEAWPLALRPTRRSVLAGAAAVTAGAPAWGTPAASTEALVVDAAGSAAYATIGAALAAAPAGGTIVVRSGLYRERLELTRAVTLVGEPGRGDLPTVEWMCDRPYEAVLTVGPLAGAVEVTGIAFRHYSPSIAQNYAIYAPGAPRGVANVATLRGCEVSSGSGSGVGVEGGEVRLLDCRVSGCKNHGVLFVGPTARGEVSGCVVEKNKLNGVFLRDGAAPRVDGNRIERNGQYGLALFDCAGSVGDNAIAANGRGAVSGECDADDAPMS